MIREIKIQLIPSHFCLFCYISQVNKAYYHHITNSWKPQFHNDLQHFVIFCS
uniref:Uncharacterized protein n=1 Tax=Octopus bimaculoides TaxID=37653 RepID=A0A0L8HS02_OCTBM